jgi:uncharacterized protein YxjI
MVSPPIVEPCFCYTTDITSLKESGEPAMRQLYIKQQVFSLTEHFTITDSAGIIHYVVDGSFFKIPKSFSIQTPQGIEVAQIEKRVFSLLPHFSVMVDGTEIATIDKELTLFKPRYRLDAQGLRVNGDWWDMNFEVSSGDQVLASISKRWFSWGDSYEVNVFDESYEILIVALVIAIDKVKHDVDSSSNAAATASY